ncbi:MAG TPA: hypothetical protein VK835_00790 [Bacteroidia bacterium]|jgi:ketosteroid isomerase-like protein|nr:hypothetical protein [Bacteroidia bacterium]
MKKIIVLLVLLAAYSCKDVDSSKSACNEIMNADKAMNELAGTEGFHKALLQFADDDVIKPNEGDLPVIGKKLVALKWARAEDTKAISWKPIRVEASTAGDLGYTFGYWTFVTKDTTLYGNYCTVWKKQKTGAWKFVFDGGNSTPKPIAE